MKKEIRECIIEAILGFPKTVIVNFKCLPLKQAIKFPILVSSHTYLRSVKGTIQIEAPVSTAMILYGFGDVGIFDKKHSRSVLELSETGTIIFHGKARFGNGVKLSVGGKLSLGYNFTVTAESSIFCTNKISFGNNCLISWEDLIMDTDVHKIICDGERTNYDQEIDIGNHVWIGCRCTILKGSNLPDNTVMSAGSLLCKKLCQPNCVLGGNPLRILKEKIDWTR